MPICHNTINQYNAIKTTIYNHCKMQKGQKRAKKVSKWKQKCPNGNISPKCFILLCFLVRKKLAPNVQMETA